MKTNFLFHISIIVLILAPLFGNTQSIVHTVDLPLKGKGQSLFIENLDSAQLLIFEPKHIRTIALQSGETNTFKAEYLHRKNLLGYSITEQDDITVYFEGDNNLINLYHLVGDKSLVRKGNLPFTLPKGEFHLSSFSMGRMFYIMTITKNSSILNFYKFNSYLSLGKQEVDLSNEFPQKSLNDYLKGITSTPGNLQLFKKPTLSITEKTYVLAEMAPTHLSKMYIADSSVLITLDHDLSSTKVINISLNQKESKVMSVSQPGSCSSYSNLYETNISNSFVTNNRLYQTRICSDGINIRVRSLSGQIYSDWTIEGKGKIQSKTNYYGFAFDGKTDMSKALKKIAKLDAGIITQFYGETVFITVGGYKQYNNIGGNLGYSSSQSGWIRSRYNSNDYSEDFSGKKTPIDAIEKYKETLSGSTKYQYIFEWNNAIYMSHYNSADKKVNILKFQ